MPHQPIPDGKRDGKYLKLLAKSTRLGYPRAMAKFGKYAMLRSDWIEAYYWMKLAQLNGLHVVSSTLNEIRSAWARDGFHSECSKANAAFTREMAAVGRALINLDSERNVEAARKYLKANHPEFL